VVKGIEVKDILQSLPSEQRPEFVKRLKAGTGVEVAFTVAGKGRKRKHRWGSARGKVVAIRFTDAQYGLVARRAAGKGLSVGDYLKWLACRSHLKGKSGGLS
jgi:hypothetical protein